VRSLRHRTERTLAAIARVTAAGSCASAARSVDVAVAPRPRRTTPPPAPTTRTRALPTRVSARAEESDRKEETEEPEPLPSPGLAPLSERSSVSFRKSETRDATPAFSVRKPTNRRLEEPPAVVFAEPPTRAAPPPSPPKTHTSTRSVTPTCVTGVTGVSDLPADALELTFAFLPPRALASAGATCRAWREVATRERLWARLLARRRGADDTSTFFDTNSLAETFSLESRWRAGKYARHDLHRHTWTVERVELVDTEKHGRVVVTGGWDGQALAWRATRRNAENKDGEPFGVGNLWEPFRLFVGPGGAWVSALDATKALVAAGDTNGRVFVWDYENTGAAARVAPRRERHDGALRAHPRRPSKKRD
jgi:hypothetical protein